MYWNPGVGIPLFVLGVIVWCAIWWFTRRDKVTRPATSKSLGKLGSKLVGKFGRKPGKKADKKDKSIRKEPTFGTAEDPQESSQEAAQEDFALDVDTGKDVDESDKPQVTHVRMPTRTDAGKRADEQSVDRVVSLFLMAREGFMFRGSDLVVAMEKAGLVYGHMAIFHRLLERNTQAGAVFSVANMLKPGSFDTEDIGQLETPGLTLFMVLPAPLSALDAWDMMLPTAQRLAKLLDGELQDEDQHPLGHQEIARMRDELRQWDRKHTIKA